MRTSQRILCWIIAGLASLLVCLTYPTRASDGAPSGLVAMPAEVLVDKIRGGLLGQLLGNLNGLPHEMKYIDEPGNVHDYVPALPDGAWTDDDTDFEWVYVVEMQKADRLLLSPQQIRRLWRQRINRRLWCANQYARQLMDLGLEPPWTGRLALNPWADFNISGQFLCETFALLAPGMPQEAARVALNYTQVAIDLEPAQTTQFFTAMIATAFLTNDLDRILDAGGAAVDPRSALRHIVENVRRWHAQHPSDWRATRRLIRDTYTRYGGGMRDRNGFELNTAATVAALLYGQGDFTRTLQTAFNLGWDCDNVAATAGTVVGVMRGYRWMLAQGWRIVDRYRNTTREHMPQDETITSFADRLMALAEKAITRNGGRREGARGQPMFFIRTQIPVNVHALEDPRQQREQLRRQWSEAIERDLQMAGHAEAQARAVYLAICLDLAAELQERHPAAWRAGMEALQRDFDNVVQALYYHAPCPAGDRLRARARAAGLPKPSQRRSLW